MEIDTVNRAEAWMALGYNVAEAYTLAVITVENGLPIAEISRRLEGVKGCQDQNVRAASRNLEASGLVTVRKTDLPRKPLGLFWAPDMMAREKERATRLREVLRFLVDGGVE